MLSHPSEHLQSPEILVLLRCTLISGRAKSKGVGTLENKGGVPHRKHCFSSITSLTTSTLFAEALSWWRNKQLGHRLGFFQAKRFITSSYLSYTWLTVWSHLNKQGSALFQHFYWTSAFSNTSLSTFYILWTSSERFILLKNTGFFHWFCSICFREYFTQFT